MISRLPKAKKAAAAGIAAVCLLALLLWIAHSHRATTYVRSWLESRALSHFGVVLESTDFSYNLLRGRLDAARIELSSDSESAPFLTASDISLDFSWAALLRGRIEIEEGGAINLGVNIVRDSSGRLNLPGSVTNPAVGDESQSVRIRSFRATPVSIRFEDRSREIGAEMPLEVFSLRNIVDLAEHVVEVRSKNPGRLTFWGRSIVVGLLEIDATVAPEKFEVTRLALEVGEGRLQIQGGLDLSSAFASSDQLPGLQVSASIPVSDVADLLGHPDSPVRGEVQLDALFGAGSEGRSLVGRVWSDRVDQLPTGAFSFDSQFTWGPDWNRLRIESGSLWSRLGQASGHAEIGLGAGDQRSRAEIILTDLDVSGLGRLLDSPVSLASVGSGRIDASWQGSAISSPDLTAEVRLQENAGSGLPVGGDFSIVGAPGLWRLETDSLRCLGTTSTGQIEFSAFDTPAALGHARMDGLVSGSTSNAGQSLLQLGRLLDEGLFAGNVLSGGTIEHRIRFAGTVEDPRVDLSLNLRGIDALGLNALGGELAVHYADKRLTVDRSEFPWNGGSLIVEGSAGLGSDDQLRLSANATSVPARLATVFLELEKPEVGGFVNARMDVSGTRDDPEMSILVEGTDLEIGGWPVASIQGRGTVTGSVLEANEIRVNQTGDGSSFAVLSGSWDFRTHEYRFRSQGRSLDIGANQFLANEVRAEVEFNARGQGSLSRPAFLAELRSAEVMIAGFDFGPMSATAEVAGDQASLQVNLPRTNVQLTAEASLNSPYPASMSVETNRLDYDLTRIDDEIAVTARMEGRFHAKGNLADWQSASASGSFSRLELSFGDAVIRNRTPIDIVLENQVVTLSPVTIVFGRSALTVAGSVPLDAGQDVAVSLNGDINLEQLPPLVRRLSPVGGLGGRVQIRGTVGGKRTSLAPDLRLGWTEGTISLPGLDAPLSEISVGMLLRDGALHVEDLEATLGDGSVRGSALLPFDSLPLGAAFAKSGDSYPHASAVLSDIPVELFGTLPPWLSGRIDLEASVGLLNLSDPWLSSGKLVATRLQLNAAGQEFRQEQPTVVTFEKGRSKLETLKWIGPGADLNATGALDSNDRSLTLDVSGFVDLGAIRPPGRKVAFDGEGTFDFRVRGTLDQPLFEGGVGVSSGRVELSSAPIVLRELELRASLSGNRVQVIRGEGVLNGGTFRLGGEARLAGFSPEHLSAAVTVGESTLHFPEGLRTVWNGDLQILSTDAKAFAMTGDVKIVEGSYTGTFRPGNALFQMVMDEGELPSEVDDSPYSLSFDTRVSTSNPIEVRNREAQLRLLLSLRLRGQYPDAELTGLVSLEEGGEIEVARNKFLVERGSIVLPGGGVEPTLDVLGSTEKRDYSIQLAINGSANEPAVTLTSTPNLAQSDIVSLLITGRTLDELPSNSTGVIADQGVALLSGQLASTVEREAQETLGLSQLRLEPFLISPEADPSVRLTVGKELGSKNRLTYSLDLTDGTDQIWVAERDLTTSVQTRAVKQSDNSYRVEIGQQLRFGRTDSTGDSGTPAPAARRLIRRILVEGETGIAEEETGKLLRLKSGQEADLVKVQKGVERLRKELVKKGFLEARVGFRRLEVEEQVDLIVNVRAGPVTMVEIEGTTEGSKSLDDVRRIWIAGLSDRQREEETEALLRDRLMRAGFVQAKVSTRVSFPQPDRKTVVLSVDEGSRFSDVQVMFEGVTSTQAEELRRELERASMLEGALSDPSSVVDFLERKFQHDGNLDVSVTTPTLAFDEPARRVELTFRVDEGPDYRLQGISFTGHYWFSEAELVGICGLDVGGRFQPEAIVAARRRIRERYRGDGFNTVRVTSRASKTPLTSSVSVAFDIGQGPREIVQEIAIQGNLRTDEASIRKHLSLRIGDALVQEPIGFSRRNLYETGAYSLVEIDPQELEVVGPPEARVKRVRLLITVRELRPHALRYSGYYDTDRGPGGTIDYSIRNLLGFPGVAGISGRFDKDIQEGRSFLTLPTLRQVHVSSSLAVTLRREQRETLKIEELGFSLSQQARIAPEALLAYGYSLSSTNLTDLAEGASDTQDGTRSQVFVSLTRSTRDSLLDSRKGSFFSSAFKIAPSWLGSDESFATYFGNFNFYIPIGRTSSEAPAFNGPRRELTFATSVRVGFAGSLTEGRDLVPEERFFAGGGTTIRGFAQDQVGPKDEIGRSIGGNSLFIWNNELRFPINRFLEGVGFVDVGNVYTRAGDWNPFDVRSGAGFGLRVRTPYFLLRFDYGFKLARREDESIGAFFVSIGQSF